METIDITPKGMTTHEGIQRVEEALEASRQATFVCYNHLKEWFEIFNNESIRRLLVEEHGFERDEVEFMFEEVRQALAKREKLFEKFLYAVAGRTHPDDFPTCPECSHPLPKGDDACSACGWNSEL